MAAATSTATKVNEETLTYLNQNQPYEIKLKKLGDLTAYRGVVFRSIVRLCFHDRRLQFSEREQIALWEDSHPNDRILQVGNINIIHQRNGPNWVRLFQVAPEELPHSDTGNNIGSNTTPKVFPPLHLRSSITYLAFLICQNFRLIFHYRMG